MTSKPGEQDTVDYGRFAERLAASREATAADPARRWDLYRDFQAEWGYVPADREPRAHEDYILDLIGAEPTDDPEGDPGIPRALADWWVLPGNSANDRFDLYAGSADWPPTWRPDPTGYGVADGLPEDSPFALPGQDRRMCVFAVEAQYCNEWGYLSAESHLDDPRVLITVGDEGWVEAARSISEFVLHQAARALLPHFAWTAYPDEFGDDLVAQVRAILPELGLLPWRELGSHAVLHGGPDVIVEIDVDGPGDPDYPLRAFGRDRRALAVLMDRLGVEWEIEEPEAGRGEDDRASEDDQ